MRSPEKNGSKILAATLLPLALILGFAILASPGCTIEFTKSPDSDGQDETSWTAFSSPTLAAEIPYPTGWHLLESPENKSVAVFPSAPPVFSDAPPAFFVQRHDAPLDAIIAMLSERTTSVETVTLDDLVLKKLILRPDRFEDEGYLEAYLGEKGGATYLISGKEGDPRLSRVASGVLH